MLNALLDQSALWGREISEWFNVCVRAAKVNSSLYYTARNLSKQFYWYYFKSSVFFFASQVENMWYTYTEYLQVKLCKEFTANGSYKYVMVLVCSESLSKCTYLNFLQIFRSQKSFLIVYEVNQRQKTDWWKPHFKATAKVLKWSPLITTRSWTNHLNLPGKFIDLNVHLDLQEQSAMGVTSCWHLRWNKG